MKFKEGDHIVLLDPGMYYNSYVSGVITKTIPIGEKVSVGKYVVKYDDGVGLTNPESSYDIDYHYKLSVSGNRNAILEKLLHD